MDATEACPPAADPLEIEIFKILDAPLEPGESLQRAFDRKERELVRVLVALDAGARGELMTRIAAGSSDDPLTKRLSRFTSERRHRIVASARFARRRAT